MESLFPGYSAFFFIPFAPMCLPLGCASWLRFSGAWKPWSVSTTHFPPPARNTNCLFLRKTLSCGSEFSSVLGAAPGSFPNCPMWEKKQSCAGKKQDGKAVTNSLAPQPCCSALCSHKGACVTVKFKKKKSLINWNYSLDCIHVPGNTEDWNVWVNHKES